MTADNLKLWRRMSIPYWSPSYLALAIRVKSLSCSCLSPCKDVSLVPNPHTQRKKKQQGLSKEDGRIKYVQCKRGKKKPTWSQLMIQSSKNSTVLGMGTESVQQRQNSAFTTCLFLYIVILHHPPQGESVSKEYLLALLVFKKLWLVAYLMCYRVTSCSLLPMA